MPCVLTPCYKLIKGPILARGFFSRVTTAEGSGSSLCCLQWGPQGMARVFKGEDDDQPQDGIGYTIFRQTRILAHWSVLFKRKWLLLVVL